MTECVILHVEFFVCLEHLKNFCVKHFKTYFSEPGKKARRLSILMHSMNLLSATIPSCYTSKDAQGTALYFYEYKNLISR